MPHSPVWDLGMGLCTQVSLHPNIEGESYDRQWCTVFRHRASGPELAAPCTHSAWSPQAYLWQEGDPKILICPAVRCGSAVCPRKQRLAWSQV